MVVAKHCDAVHCAGAGEAVVMWLARVATRVSLEENIASDFDVLKVYSIIAGWVVRLRCDGVASSGSDSGLAATAAEEDLAA